MRNILMVLLGLILLANCSPKSNKKKKSTFNKLNLGKPGTTVFANNLQKQDGTHVFEGDETVNFLDSTGMADISFDPSRAIKEGDVIVANSDQKMMLKVVKIQSSDEPGKIRAKTKLANFGDLSDKSEKSSMSFEITPVLGKDKPISDAKGAVVQQVSGLDDVYSIDDSGRIEFKDVELFSFKLNNDGQLSAGFTRFLGNPPRDRDEVADLVASAGGQVKGTLNHGVIEIIPTFRGTNEWSWGRPVIVETEVDALVKMKMDVTYKTEGKVSGTAIFDLIKQISVPVRIPGPVPVYVDIELALPVVVKIEATKASETRILFEANYAFKGQVAYSKEKGTMTTNNERDVQVVGKQVSSTNNSAQLNGEISLQPRVTTRFYRVMGPYIFFQPYIRGELQYPQVEKKDDLFVGVRGGVGVQVAEPVFLTTILNVDSGDDLFGWETSWDLDSKGSDKAEAFKFPEVDENSALIRNLTDEGFVNVDLKSIDQPKARFALVEGPKHGLAVASKNVFYDGEIMYFPSGDSAEDSMKVAFVSPDGKRVEKQIKLQISPEAIAAAKEDRFGQTTNSTDVAFGHPEQFRGRVGTVSPMKNPATVTATTISAVKDKRLENSCAYIDSQVSELKFGEDGLFPIEMMEERSCRQFADSVSQSMDELRLRVEKDFYVLADEVIALIKDPASLKGNKEGPLEPNEIPILYRVLIKEQLSKRSSRGNTPFLYELSPRHIYLEKYGRFVTRHEHFPSLKLSTQSSLERDLGEFWGYDDFDNEVYEKRNQTNCSHNVLEYSWRPVKESWTNQVELEIAPKRGHWCDTQPMTITIGERNQTKRIKISKGLKFTAVQLELELNKSNSAELTIGIDYDDFVFRPQTMKTILIAEPLFDEDVDQFVPMKTRDSKEDLRY